MKNTIILILVIFILSMIFAYLKYVKPKNQQNERTLLWLNHIMQTKNGWNELSGHYSLVSFDHGKTWYHTKRTDDKPVYVYDAGGYVNMSGFTDLKPADPKLLQVIKSWEQIINQTQHGGINISKPENQNLLKQAGFTITEKSPKQ